jgi:Asp/Glu/hydantoin racemase
MEVGVVHVTTEAASGAYTELITANLEKAKSPGTAIVHRYVGHLRRATDAAFAYPTLLNKVDVVEQFLDLEREGVDAVFVACSGDPGVQEARSLLHIPVVGPMEAAMSLACSYGWRFGIVTVEDPSWASYMDQLVHTYGFSSRYSGLRRLETPTAVVFTEGFTNPELVRKDIEARAREVVAEGADAILLGSAGLSTFATSFGLSRLDEPEVPIFDVLSVGLKFAELRAELQQQLGVPPVSRAGWHFEFDETNVARLHHTFGRTPATAPQR